MSTCIWIKGITNQRAPLDENFSRMFFYEPDHLIDFFCCIMFIIHQKIVVPQLRCDFCDDFIPILFGDTSYLYLVVVD